MISVLVNQIISFHKTNLNNKPFEHASKSLEMQPHFNSSRFECNYSNIWTHKINNEWVEWKKGVFIRTENNSNICRNGELSLAWNSLQAQ